MRSPPGKRMSPLNPWGGGGGLFHRTDESTGQCRGEGEPHRKEGHWNGMECSHPWRLSTGAEGEATHPQTHGAGGGEGRSGDCTEARVGGGGSWDGAETFTS